MRQSLSHGGKRIMYQYQRHPAWQLLQRSHWLSDPDHLSPQTLETAHHIPIIHQIIKELTNHLTLMYYTMT